MWEYILLGALQGIFEWIPVSSEGVVALFSRFLVKDFNSVDLAIFLHSGTLLALLVYFYKDWKDLIMIKDKEFFKFFIIVTLVSGALGYFVYQFSRSAVVGSGLLLLTGFGLILTSFLQKKKMELKINKSASAFLVGMLQGLSALPGFSRSGSTIFGLSLTEKDPVLILKQSYLISAPVVLASSLYLFLKNPTLASQGWIALVFSFLFGLLFLKIMLDWAKKIDFSALTLIFGLLCLLGAGIFYL
ncbi:MAG: undecaprenyl-diphosphate phosphatase [Candidatus Pacebacteria bacterium]|nr:undecaprenyl-diphosphate phosphatase [Candidatus Paceibacterota bacterium]